MPVNLKQAPRGRRQSFSVAMRMARRDIRRHRGRSLLIVLLIMLPVAGMTGAVTLLQSALETPAERVQHQLGQAQARYQKFSSGNETFVQDPVNETIISSNNGEWDPDFVGAHPGEVLPAGYSVLTESAFDVMVKFGHASIPVMGNEVDALNPAFAGKFSLRQGRAPAASGEVLVSQGLLEQFGLKVGDDFATSRGTFAAVGTIRDAGLSDRNAILYLLPGQVSKHVAEPGADELAPQRRDSKFYLVGPRPVTWEQIRAANSMGVAVLSRQVALDPPSLAERGLDGSSADMTPPVSMSAYLASGYIGALALLEVGLLAGAAFAVGAKRQVRELALLAASGAEAPTVRAVVMAGGLWLGGLAVVGGAAVGLAGAAVAVAVARSLGSARFPGFHPDALLTAGAMAMGLIACLLSAYAPARQISRQAALGALKSGRSPSSPPTRTTRIGAGALLLSVGSLVAGAAYAASTDHPDVLADRFPLVSGLLISGAVLAVIALLLLAGGILTFVAGRSRRLPLAVRMASRDAARNLGRTVPAVAAVLAAATLASAGMVAAASEQGRSLRNTGADVLVNQMQLPLERLTPLTPSGSLEPDSAALDPAQLTIGIQKVSDAVSWSRVLTYPAQIQGCGPASTSDAGLPGEVLAPTGNCHKFSLAVPEGNECAFTEGGRVRHPGDWRCQGPMMPYPAFGSTMSLLVGGPEDIRATFGRDAPEEAGLILDAGGIVVTNPVFVRDGSAVIRAEDVRRPVDGNGAMAFEVDWTSTLPAIVVEPVSNIRLFGIISPATAERLGIQTEAAHLRVQFSHYPSNGELDAIFGELASTFGNTVGFNIQRGEVDQGLMLWAIVGLAALITLSAAGITTGLSLADARTDHMTLAGVGASPGLRKALAGSRALLTVGLGTLLGSAAGAIPMLLIMYSTDMKPYAAVPWLQLGALLVVVPLTAAALAWLFTRARLPMSRRAVGT